MRTDLFSPPVPRKLPSPLSRSPGSPRGHDFAAGSPVLMNGLTALQVLDNLEGLAGR